MRFHPALVLVLFAAALPHASGALQGKLIVEDETEANLPNVAGPRRRKAMEMNMKGKVAATTGVKDPPSPQDEELPASVESSSRVEANIPVEVNTPMRKKRSSKGANKGGKLVKSKKGGGKKAMQRPNGNGEGKGEDSILPECQDGIRKDSVTIGTFTGNSEDASNNENATTTPTADYYYSCDPSVARKAPLVIIVPGADAGKAKYSMAAKAFVDRGYTAAVLEEASVVSSGAFGQSITVYLASSRTLKAFIDIVAADESGFPANTDEINLVGHSFGGTTVLFYMAGECPPEFCTPAESVLVSSDKIKGVANFGSTLTTRDFRTNAISFEERLKNFDYPIFQLNGSFDIKNVALIGDENIVDGTLDRLLSFAGLATIEGLDHYSIVNELIPFGAGRNNQFPSTDSREFQVEAVVTVLDTWFVTTVNGNFEETCEDQLKKAAASSYSLTRCDVK
jgi:hypothetical protein